MKSLAWLTDVHCNFVSDSSWFDKILDDRPNAILITGDIAEAKSLAGVLRMFADKTSRPIYFVLGNHDFYHGTIADVREATRAMCFPANVSTSLRYLHSEAHIPLSKETTLVGVDGWYDGRNGDVVNSHVALNDFRAISDFKTFWDSRTEGMQKKIRAKMRDLADESASLLRTKLRGAIQPSTKRLIIATHVPPFAGAAWHEGMVSDSDHLPYFSNRSVGEAITEETAVFREKLGGLVEVLCGHTHSEGTIYPAEGLIVRTGAAEYYNPGKCGNVTYE